MAHSSLASALAHVRKRPGQAPGLLNGQPMLLAPLTPFSYRPPKIYGHAWIAAWQDQRAFEAFDRERPRDDYCVLLRPVRIVGNWSAYPGLPPGEHSVGDGPAAVLTLGRLKPTRALAFLRASAQAERDALENPAMSFGTAMASPSLTVATFSIWNDLGAMREYVTHGGHHHAKGRHSQRPFHRESAFIRYEILAQHGDPPHPRTDARR